ncbi:hypothetical protein Q5752_003914 [Cryptotrichosporon argae]
MPSYLTSPYTQTALDQPGPSSASASSSVSSYFAPTSQSEAVPAPMPTPRSRRSQTSPSASNSPPLDSVPEDASCKPAAPVRRASPDKDGVYTRSNGRTRGSKMRARDPVSASAPVQQRTPRADWIVDLVKARNGAESWESTERVILVLGDATPDLLAPLLLNPTFGRTLILVGSSRPQSAFDNLAALFPNRAIYPRVQAYCPPSAMLSDSSHPLPALITHALTLSDAYRRSPRARRRNSDDSTDSLTPPLTPRGSRLSLFRRGSDASAKSGLDSPRGSVFDRSNSSNSLADRSPRSRFSAMPSFGRSDSHTSPAGKRDAVAPFDAVLHFVPDAKGSPRALQDLLHQSMVLTTALMPHLSRRRTQPGALAALADAIALLHILPADAPPVLGPVVEQFITSLQPALSGNARPIFPTAVSAHAWMSPRVDGGVADVFNGAEVVLFGGVRNAPTTPYADLALRPRAYIRAWHDCVPGPGVLADARHAQAHTAAAATSAPPSPPQSTSSRSGPPSVPYTSTAPAPRAPADAYTPVPPKTIPRSASGLRNTLKLDDADGPGANLDARGVGVAHAHAPARIATTPSPPGHARTHAQPLGLGLSHDARYGAGAEAADPAARGRSSSGSASDESDPVRTPETGSERGSIRAPAKGIKKWFRRRGVVA